MASHSSATAREEAPHVNRTSRTNTIVNAVKRRAQAVLNDKSIDAQTRAIIRYGLETNDPWLAELVRRADAGEIIDDDIQSLDTSENDSSEDEVEALTDLICRSGEEPSAVLLALMATLENATYTKALANTVKHLAFTRCGELNVNRMIDAQVALIIGRLRAGNTSVI